MAVNIPYSNYDIFIALMCFLLPISPLPHLKLFIVSISGIECYVDSVKRLLELHLKVVCILAPLELLSLFWIYL